MTATCRGGHHVTPPDATSCACGDITYVPAPEPRHDGEVCPLCTPHPRHADRCEHIWPDTNGLTCACRKSPAMTAPEPPAETQEDDEHAHPALRDALCRYLDDRADYADRGSLSDDFAELWAYVAPALVARPSADTETLRDALLKHHPIAHTMTGALKGCRCGQVKLGQDVIAHVADELQARLALRRDEALATCSDRHFDRDRALTMYCEQIPGHVGPHVNHRIYW